MLSSLLPAAAPPQGRISQLLPSVKCSTCHQPVPLAELGEHTCTAPPPVPELPKPSLTPQAATALLPDRLQGRVTSPSSPAPRGPPPHPPDPAPQPNRSASSTRLQISTQTPSQSSFQARSSPLARAPDDPFQSPAASRLRTASNVTSPATARPLGSFSGAPTPTGPPMRSASASVSGAYPFPAQQPPQRIGSTPPQNQPQRMGSPASFTQQNRGQPPSAGYSSTPPPGSSVAFPARPGPIQQSYSAGNVPTGGYQRNLSGPPAPASASMESSEAFVPPAERGIDTKTGGAAGMAGVGRRGFAAAARAAMFALPHNGRPGGSQPPYSENQDANGNGRYARRPNAPQFLDIDAVSRCELHSLTWSSFIPFWDTCWVMRVQLICGLRILGDSSIFLDTISTSSQAVADNMGVHPSSLLAHQVQHFSWTIMICGFFSSRIFAFRACSMIGQPSATKQIDIQPANDLSFPFLSARTCGYFHSSNGQYG